MARPMARCSDCGLVKHLVKGTALCDLCWVRRTRKRTR